MTLSATARGIHRRVVEPRGREQRNEQVRGRATAGAGPPATEPGNQRHELPNRVSDRIEPGRC